MAKLKPSEKKHYVNNVEFLSEMKLYKQQILDAEDRDEERPKVPDCIALKIYNICNKLSYSHSYINYSYRDEMVADGIENCLRYIRNFDHNKSENPFSYFTQITYYAFLRRIEREQKQFATKAKYVQSTNLILDMEDQMDTESRGEIDFGSEEHHKYLDTLYAFDLNIWEEKKNKNKNKVADNKSKLSDFL